MYIINDYNLKTHILVYIIFDIQTTVMSFRNFKFVYVVNTLTLSTRYYSTLNIYKKLFQ